jgi:hypothetical protein
VAGSPEDVLNARLVGGELDGMVVEIDAGVETLHLGPPMIAFGSPPEAVERLRGGEWEYRFVGLEDSEEGRQAVFELVVPAAGA